MNARTTDAQWSLFFSLKSRNFGLGQTNWADKFWGLWVLCHCFLSFNHYIYKKLSFCINIQNIYLGLGFEFGLQRISDLAFVCPWLKLECLSVLLVNIFDPLCYINVRNSNFSILKKNRRHFPLLPWLPKQPQTANPFWKFGLSSISLVSIYLGINPKRRKGHISDV